MPLAGSKHETCSRLRCPDASFYASNAQIQRLARINRAGKALSYS
jgi:hypothetical protein